MGEAMKSKYEDYPLEEILQAVAKLADEGWDVYQKFTCSGCGQRLTIDEANTFYAESTCDRCDAVTDIRKQGCNYLLIGKAGIR